MCLSTGSGVLRHNAEVTNGGSGGGDTAVNHHWKIVWGDNIIWGVGGGRSRISPDTSRSISL